MTPADLDTVYDFWFGDTARASNHDDRLPLWFGGGDELDATIRERFGDWIDEAAAKDWDLAALTERQRLGLIVLLDQFPRNVHRGTPRVYRYDGRAQEICAAAFEAGMEGLAPIERMFAGMPLIHSENLAYHEMAVADLHERILPAVDQSQQLWQGTLRQSALYLDIIRRFGRFPHRNAILGRETTPEEAAFLAETKMTP